MSWNTPPNIDMDADKLSTAKKIDELANAVGQFLAVEARNRNSGNPCIMATAAMAVAIKIAGALAALTPNKEARENLAKDLSEQLKVGIMACCDEIDGDGDLQGFLKKLMDKDSKMEFDFPTDGEVI